MSGLVGDVVTAEVEIGEPDAESGVEPGVGQRTTAVGVEDVGGKQGQVSAFGRSGWVAGVPVGVVGQGLLAAFFEPVHEIRCVASLVIRSAKRHSLSGDPPVTACATEHHLDRVTTIRL